MDADAIINVAVSTDIEIGETLAAMRKDRVSRIQQADRGIPKLYADIKRVEERVTAYREDREWCQESLKTLDRRIAELEE